MQSEARGEKRSGATRPTKKALLTRRAKREVQKMSRAEQLRVTDAATVARAVADSGPLAGFDHCVRPARGTTLPCSALAAGRPRLAHYSKSGMQSRAAAADNNFLGRTFLSPNFRVSSSVRSVRSAARSLPTTTTTARSSLL